MRMHMIHVPGVAARESCVETIRTTPGVDLQVHEDPQRRGLMWNWLKMLVDAAKETETGWAVLLNDDVVPAANDWVEHLQSALDNSPTRLLGMTHFGAVGQRAADRGAPYGVGKYAVCGAAVAIRADLIRPLARWLIAVHQRTGYPHDDVLTCAYMNRIGEKTAMTSRALFGLDGGKSLLGHNPPINYPYLTIADDGPDWTDEPNHVPITRSVPKSMKWLIQEEGR